MTKEQDYRHALEAIRAMLAGYAGQPNHFGDVFKIADGALAIGMETRRAETTGSAAKP